MRGRAIKISQPRRMVADLLFFARRGPSIPMQRVLGIGAVAQARAAAKQRPHWTAIFVKAYALTLSEFPALRRAYVSLPWPHFFEYPRATASVIVEREYRGEPALFSYLIKRPDDPLLELSRLLDQARTAPVDEIKQFRNALTSSALPRDVRRPGWWLGLNVGRIRGNYFGTFGVSVYSAYGAESLHPLSPLTSLLNYGVIGPDGAVRVRVIFDPRVVDEPVVTRALVRLEDILNGPVREELNSLRA